MKNICKLSAVGTLILAFLLARPAGAQLAPLGPETVVVAGNDLGLQCPQVIGHADRSFTVVWVQSPLPTDASIVAQRFDSAGPLLGGPIDVNAGGLKGRVWSDIQVANRGALGDIVTWTSFMAGAPDTTLRFDSRVLSAAVPARVFAPSYVRKLYPRIVGGYLATWLTMNFGATSLEILDANGRPTSPTVRINRTDPVFFQTAQATNGSFTVDWFHTSPPRTFRLQRFGPMAQPLGPETRIEDAADFLRLASAPDGRTALAFVDFTNGPAGFTSPLRTQFFGADGRPAGPAFTVNTPPRPAVIFAPQAVAMDRLGRELIVWEFLAANPTVERYTLQVLTPTGAAQSMLLLGAEPLHALDPANPFCAAAASAGRTWVVAWRAMQPDGTQAIFVRRFFS